MAFFSLTLCVQIAEACKSALMTYSSEVTTWILKDELKSTHRLTLSSISILAKHCRIHIDTL
jgi:hypothetical protein